jgi:hypothetical protein
VRASAGISTTLDDVERLEAALRIIATTPPPVPYTCDPQTGAYWPAGLALG